MPARGAPRLCFCSPTEIYDRFVARGRGRGAFDFYDAFLSGRRAEKRYARARERDEDGEREKRRKIEESSGHNEGLYRAAMCARRTAESRADQEEESKRKRKESR